MLSDTQMSWISKTQSKARMYAVAGLLVTLVVAIIAGAFFGLAPTDDQPLAVGVKEKIFQPLMVAWLFWLGMGICSLAVVMLHHLCGGAWSYTIQRFVEAGSRTIPFFFITGIVIMLPAVYFTDIYPWTNEAYVHQYHIVAEKAAFLNPSTYTIAYFIYFTIWMLFMWLYNGWSKRLDETADDRIIGKMKFWAGPGLVLYVLSVTMAATHFAMSLEPVWFSTIYGAWLISSYALSVVSFSVIVLSYLMNESPIKEKVTTRTFHHLGNFLLGFTIFWSYVSFSQFLLIWNANLPEEIGFYLHREGSSLTVMTVFLCAFHWFVPMMILLIRKNKTSIVTLRKIAYYVFFVRILDLYWNTVPSFPDGHYAVNWTTLFLVITAILGLGGVWVFLFLNELKKRPLLPVNDPRGELMFLKDAHGHA
ncbi:MAG: hypothetical protein GC168_14250 [Candidatus Hydrogenedens sp.]|nr:hypothetical protein [Candidatus Hydrogenedens sp.]